MVRYNILTSQGGPKKDIYVEHYQSVNRPRPSDSTELVYVPDIAIDTTKNINSINLSVSSPGPEYYIAGYNISNRSVDMDLDYDGSIVILYPSVIIDTVYIDNSYDAEWHVTLSHNNSAARIDEIMALFIDDYDDDAHQRFVYKKRQIKSETVNFMQLISYSV